MNFKQTRQIHFLYVIVYSKHAKHLFGKAYETLFPRFNFGYHSIF